MKKANIVAVAGLVLMCSSSARAHELTNWFGLDWPLVYVQAGLEVDPSPGNHPFPWDSVGIPPPTPGAPWVFWDPNQAPDSPPVDWPAPPPTFTDYWPGIGVRFRGTTVHNYAPHPGEIVPSTKWIYDITVPEPSAVDGWGTGGWWWAGEERIATSRAHPYGHPDAYMAVVGVLRGTVPGPSIAPRRVIIGGSIGVHPDPPPGSNPQIICGGAQLLPPSRVPSPDGDLPGGELLCILDMTTSRLALLMIVDGLQGSRIANVYVRQGPSGPVLMDLLPLTQLQYLGEYDSALKTEDAPMPLSVVEAVRQGNAYVSVGFAPEIHPDGVIGGGISVVAIFRPLAGDINGDGHVNVIDLVIFAGSWAKHTGEPGFNSACDLNDDGVVDLSDLLILSKNWGS